MTKKPIKHPRDCKSHPDKLFAWIIDNNLFDGQAPEIIPLNKIKDGKNDER